MARELGAAVVGCGAIAQTMHLPNILRHPSLRLAWCCDVDPDVLGAAASRFHPANTTSDARDIASDPDCDVVFLCTTQEVRLPLIDLFSRAGKHLFVEKPMADTFEEMKAILHLARRSDVRITIGHNRRAAPAVREALCILDKHRADPVSPP